MPRSQPARGTRRQGGAGSWAARQRLEFIEFRLFWEGRVNRADLCEHFGIATAQASLDLRRYLKMAPRNVGYDKSRKLYYPRERFTPRVIRTDAGSYLSRLALAAAGHLPEAEGFGGFRPPVEVVPSFHRQIRSDILARIVRAMKAGRSVEIEYQSMTRPEPSRRWLAPITLVWTGRRWHIRAFCEQNRDYRDFLLARIQSVQPEDRLRPEPLPPDPDWEETVEVEVGPNPGLEPSQRQTIEWDFGMTDGKVGVRLRRAMLRYFCQAWRLGRLDTALPARVQQIVLLNPAEVEAELEKLGYPHEHQANS